MSIGIDGLHNIAKMDLQGTYNFNGSQRTFEFDGKKELIGFDRYNQPVLIEKDQNGGWMTTPLKETSPDADAVTKALHHAGQYHYNMFDVDGDAKADQIYSDCCIGLIVDLENPHGWTQATGLSVDSEDTDPDMGYVKMHGDVNRDGTMDEIVFNRASGLRTIDLGSIDLTKE